LSCVAEARNQLISFYEFVRDIEQWEKHGEAGIAIEIAGRIFVVRASGRCSTSTWQQCTAFQPRD